MDGEHPGVIANVYRGKARVRYPEENETLAVQARSRHICRKAVDAYLDAGERVPGTVTAQWPGQYVECSVQEWFS